MRVIWEILAVVNTLVSVGGVFIAVLWLGVLFTKQHGCLSLILAFVVAAATAYGVYWKAGVSGLHWEEQGVAIGDVVLGLLVVIVGSLWVKAIADLDDDEQQEPPEPTPHSDDDLQG